MTFDEVQAVACPYCGAAPGKKCTRLGRPDRPLATPHFTRCDAAAKAAKEPHQ